MPTREKQRSQEPDLFSVSPAKKEVELRFLGRLREFVLKRSAVELHAMAVSGELNDIFPAVPEDAVAAAPRRFAELKPFDYKAWETRAKLHAPAVSKPNPAFVKPMTPTGALAAVVGSKPIPRIEVTRKIWAYIKKNKLQDAKNKRMINADAKLKGVFGGRNKVSMLDLPRMVSKLLK